MPHSEGQAGSKERKHRIMQSETLRKRQIFEVPATIVTFLALSADTGGSFSLFEYRVAPQQGIPLHRHSDDEAFLVLEGTLQFQIEAFLPGREKPHRHYAGGVEFPAVARLDTRTGKRSHRCRLREQEMSRWWREPRRFVFS